jgi:hypothetical protein
MFLLDNFRFESFLKGYLKKIKINIVSKNIFSMPSILEI